MSPSGSGPDQAPRTGEPPYLPLVDVRVLDLSRLIVGSLATRYLADLGAEVVKVEHPRTGDYLRAVPPMVGAEGVWHHLLNRNKKSVALDISVEADRNVLLQLIDVVDVVVEVSRPGSLLRLGIDLALLRRERPELIVCSITGFGQTGPWSSLPAHGMNLDALAGTAATEQTAHGLRFVQLAYTSLGNEHGALNAALAITAALQGVRTDGVGAWIDISCWDALIELNRCAIAYQTATGRTVADGADHLWGAMHRLYTAKDGKQVFLAVIEEKFWKRFCQGIGRPDLQDRWNSDSSLDYGDDELRRELEPIMAARTTKEWEKSFLEWSIPGSPVMTLDDVLQHPHLEARGLLELDAAGGIPNVTSPIRWMDHGGARPGSPPSPPPGIGQHTEEVLHGWLNGRANSDASG